MDRRTRPFRKRETALIMREKSWHLVAYDVCDPARLRKVGRIMKGYGERKQFSVYCCYLTDRGRERLRWEIKKIMKDEDELLMIELCENCVKRLKSTHAKGAWPDEPASFEVV